LILSTYDGNGFRAADYLAYKENGRFYRSDGSNYSFAEHRNGKVILKHFDSSNIGHVSYEKLSNLNDIDPSAFSGKVWVPRSLSQCDYFARMFRTETIPEIPGYIIVNDGATYTPLALKNFTETWMSFNYLRDQYEVQLQNIEDETLLYNYGDYFSDASEIPVISEGDILQIYSDGHNKAGKIGFSDLVSFSLSLKGGESWSSLLNLVWHTTV